MSTGDGSEEDLKEFVMQLKPGFDTSVEHSWEALWKDRFKHDENVLHKACCRLLPTNALRVLLVKGGSALVNIPDIFGQTPLHSAMECPPDTRLERITALLDFGADGSIEDKDGNTAIMV